MVFSFDDFEINMLMMEAPREYFHIRDCRGYSKACISLYEGGKWCISDGFMAFVFDHYEFSPGNKNITLSLDGELCGLISTEGCNVGDLEGKA